VTIVIAAKNKKRQITTRDVKKRDRTGGTDQTISKIMRQKQLPNKRRTIEENGQREIHLNNNMKKN